MSIDSPSPAVGSGHANEVLLKQLGEVTVHASRLEHLAVDIARSLKIDTTVPDAVVALQRPKLTPPPWSSVAAKEYLGRYLKRLTRHLAAGAELQSRLDYHDENGQRWPLVTIYGQRDGGE